MTSHSALYHQLGTTDDLKSPKSGRSLWYAMGKFEVISSNCYNKYHRLTEITTDITDYYQDLNKYVSMDNLEFLSLFRLPRKCVYKEDGIPEDNKVDFFQAIFCNKNLDNKNAAMKKKSGQKWLKIVFTSIRPDIKQHYKDMTHHFTFSETSMPSETRIKKIIIDNTQQGGRCVCLQKTGDTKFSLTKFTAIKVDLYFEMPVRHCDVRYMYTVINVPIQRRVKVFKSTRYITDSCDYIGVFQKQLLIGWRLVDILTDKDEFILPDYNDWDTKRRSLWLYEKPKAAINDLTPRFVLFVLSYCSCFTKMICSKQPSYH